MLRRRQITTNPCKNISITDRFFAAKRVNKPFKVSSTTAGGTSKVVRAFFHQKLPRFFAFRERPSQANDENIVCVIHLILPSTFILLALILGTKMLCCVQITWSVGDKSKANEPMTERSRNLHTEYRCGQNSSTANYFI